MSLGGSSTMTPKTESNAPLLLAVSPEPELSECMAQKLRHAGFRVESARPGLACMEAFRAMAPAGVVLGKDLPEAEGLELCRALRKLPGGKKLPVVMWMPSLDDAVVSRAKEAGISEFLSDRVGTSLLEHRVQHAIEYARLGLSLVAANDELAAATESEDAFCSREAFLDGLASVLPRAQADGSHLAVFWAELSSESFEPKSGQDFTEFTLERLRVALEDLKDESGLLNGSVRIAPIGWQQYALMVSNLERVQDATKIAARMQEVLAEQFDFEGDSRELTANVGISIYPSDAVGAKGLLERAQTACYYASQDTASSHWFYAESMNRWAFERLTLEQNLREALANDELTVYYQPRVDVQSRRVIGMEALVRWIHPTLGIISPGQFIPLAEESGLIVPLGEFVLREACRQNKEWQDAGLPPVRVSVNLSAVQFRKSDLYEVVTRAIEDTGLDTQWLELELTESMLMQDPKATTETLQRLKSAGIHLSIDDFGTGYSSLSYLKRFPIDALKIDRSFVSDITTNPDDAAIATTIILMAHSLRLNVVAEGVETESQLSFLSVLQCNEIQGFLFSPPVPADKARELVGAEMSSVFSS